MILYRDDSIYLQIDNSCINISYIILAQDALGITFRREQLEYLIYGDKRKMMYRFSGKTLCYIVKLCLSEGDDLDIKKPYKYADELTIKHHNIYSHSHFKREFLSIRKKLVEAGIKVRGIK